VPEIGILDAKKAHSLKMEGGCSQQMMIFIHTAEQSHFVLLKVIAVKSGREEYIS
jgi:hypothetical protein